MSRPFKFRYANEIAGGFVILALLLFVGGVFMAGRAQGWFEGKFRLTTRFEGGQGSFGLREGAEVLVMDTVAGRVSAINPTENGRMEAILIVRNRFLPLIREDAVARVKRKFGVTGDAFLDVEMGSGAPIKEDAVIPSVRDEELMETARRTLLDLQAETLPMLEHVKGILANVNTITDGLAKGDGLAGAALSDEEMVTMVKAILTTTDTLMTDSTRAVHETTRLLQGLQRHWLLRKYVPSDAPEVVLSPRQLDPLKIAQLSRDWETDLALARRTGDAEQIAIVAANLAYAALTVDDTARARDYFTEALMACRAGGIDLKPTLMLEAQLAKAEGHPRDAYVIIKPLLEERGGSREVNAMLHILLAETCLVTGNTDQADQALNDGDRTVRRAGAPFIAAYAEELRARLRLREADLIQAARHFDTAGERYQEAELFAQMANALHGAGKAYAAAGRHGEAADRLYRAGRGLLGSALNDEGTAALQAARSAALKADNDIVQAQIETLARAYAIEL